MLAALLATTARAEEGKRINTNLRESFSRAMDDVSTAIPPTHIVNPSHPPLISAVELELGDEGETVNIVELKLPYGRIRVRIEERKERWRQAELDAQEGFRHLSLVPRLFPRWAQMKDDIKWESRESESGFHWWAGVGQDSDGLNRHQIIVTGHANERHEFARGGFGWRW